MKPQNAPDLPESHVEASAMPVAPGGDSPVPLYHRIYVHLRNRIAAGQVQAGHKLPGEQDLAREFGVSRITAKRALNELAASGFVVRERGRGTRVLARPQTPCMRASLEGWLENISLMGVATAARVLEFDYLPAAPDVAEALAVEAGTLVQRAVRVRSQDGESLSYLTTWLPEDIGRDFDAADLERQPLLQLLERSGIRIGAARQTVSATLADPGVASALAIHAGAPLLQVSRVVSDKAGRPVEFIRALYRPDRYRFEMDLTRIGDTENPRWAAQPASRSPGNGARRGARP